jgi:hypothetical protein
VKNRKGGLNMGFFKPAWMSGNKGIALGALEKETDQTKLAEIAKNAPLSDIRGLAVCKLTSYSALVEAERNDRDHMVRKAAQHTRQELVNKITDQTILSEIAKTDIDAAIRKAAVQKLTNQSVLEEIAMHEEYPFVRAGAIVKLTNQSLRDKLSLELCSIGHHFFKINLQNYEQYCSVCGYIPISDKSKSSASYGSLLSKAKDMGLDCNKGSHYWGSPELMPQYSTGRGVRCLICGKTEIYDYNA